MPVRLRPTSPLAPDAILVGDPGRALLLAQELLEEPKMSNHARGLWGYSGTSRTGRPLTIQSTGIGGPSAALVLADLATLGVRRALRVGTCIGFGESCEPGTLLLVTAAIAAGGSAAALGAEPGQIVSPGTELNDRLRDVAGDDATEATIASFDAHPADHAPPAAAIAADMQTAPLLAKGRSLGVEVAALLIVAETATGPGLERESLEDAERRAGRAAASALST